MKFSIFPQFGALNSKPIFQAFVAGAQRLGHTVTEHDLNADVLVIWSVLWSGRMKSNQEIYNFAKKTGKKLIILEVGGLVRGTTWRVGLGHINNLATFYQFESFDNDRPKKLGIIAKKREKIGQNILICGQHSNSEQWQSRPSPEIWIKNLITEIKSQTDRQIIFRPHPRDQDWVKNMKTLGAKIEFPVKMANSYDDFDHEVSFQNAFTIFSPCGNAGIHGALSGIPIFTDFDSLAYPVSNKSLEKLSDPELPDRTSWLIKLCHTEWTVEEISQGLPLARIL